MQDVANFKVWALGLILIVLAACVADRPGNWLWWRTWERIAARRNLPTGTGSNLAHEIGAWERVIYIFGAAHSHYDFIGGWLLMKAFFNWIPNSAREQRPSGQAGLAERDRSTIMDHYNGFLIGNLISLSIGISLGLIVKFLFLWIRIRYNL